MPAQSRAVAIALPQSAAQTANEADSELSLNRIVAALQLLLATRRAARSEEHAYWYTVARGI